MRVARILLGICILLFYVGELAAQGNNPTVNSLPMDIEQYSVSLALSKNMKFAVAIQSPHRRAYVYSLKDKGHVIATINEFASPRTVVFDGEIANRFYVVDGARGTVTIVDITEDSYRVVQSIHIEKGIHGMVLDARRKRLFVTNPTNGKLYVVDLRKNGVILSKDGFPGVQQALAINPMGTVLYLGSEETKTIYVLNAQNLEVTEKIEEVYGMSDIKLNTSGARLYVTSITHNMLFVYSTATNKLLASVPTGASPFSIAVPPNNTALVTSNIKDSSLTVISSLHMNVVRTIKLASLPAGAVVASRHKSTNDIVYVLDKNMNILVVNWPMGLVQNTIE